MSKRRRATWKLVLASFGILILLAAATIAIFVPNFFELLVAGDERDLREQPSPSPQAREPTVLVLALDGVDRSLLYEMLRAGELPALAQLLGGLDHAYLDETAIAPMPTSTLASWATIFTGVTPALHGVAGNEYFIRAEKKFAAPAPVSINEPDLVMKTYTDGYANELLKVPTLYERLRESGPLKIWVAMSQFYQGADKLILADRSVLADAFAAFLDADDDADDLELFAKVDEKVIENVEAALAEGPPPHLLTLYLSGADQFAHASKEGPDKARRRYLRDVMEKLMTRVTAALAKAAPLDDRYVVVVSDHGHTAVMSDDSHALGTTELDDPPMFIRAAGYHLRPFEADVSDSDGFDTVLAYGGAVAYLYVADRSTCAKDRPCEWSRPARFVEDVVPLADVFLKHTVQAAGGVATLDLVLVRSQQPGSTELEVYLGDRKTQKIGAYLAAHPRPAYIAVEDRLRDLAVGPYGNHAGDIVLMTRSGNEQAIENRYYFSNHYYSWHGGLGRTDSEIPLIVAHPRKSTAQLGALVREVAGERSDATDVAPLVTKLLGRTWRK